MGKLANKTALVTGSSRGIGRATALRLAQEGALVAVHYATGEDAALSTVADIEAAGGRAFAVRSEFGVPGDVDTLFEALESGLKERTGVATLDILVNNAAIMGGVPRRRSHPSSSTGSSPSTRRRRSSSSSARSDSSPTAGASSTSPPGSPGSPTPRRPPTR